MSERGWPRAARKPALHVLSKREVKHDQRSGRAGSGRLDRRGVSGKQVQRRDRTSAVDLVDRGIIRVLDLVVLRKDTDGSIEAFELG